MMENMMKRCEGKEHIIKEGDTLYKISRMHNVSLEDLLKSNTLVNVYNLKVGDKICVPVKNEDVNDNEYENLNNMQNMNSISNMIDSDRISNIPNITNRDSMKEVDGFQNDIRPEHNMVNNKEGSNYNRMFVYVVKEGDTLDNILEQYDVDMDDLMDANKQNKIMLKPGSIVIVPAMND